MKSKKLLLLERLLRFMAVVVLKRHKPKIVAITGSVGKTSAREAVFAVLSSKYKVRETAKNYNNEVGIPLVVIGAESGGRNIFKWIWVFLKWIFDIIFPFYPEILVFELGVDRQGDMKYFMSFIRPDVGIVTNISLSHIEFFKTVENIAKEKRVLIESLNPDGFAVLNIDDELVRDMAINTKANLLTFGISEDAQVNVSNLVYNFDGEKPEGISFKLNYDGKNVPIRLKNFFARHYVYPALAGISAGIIFKINLVDIAQALETLKPPLGRLNLLEGANGSFIFDDTYNASPISTLSALEVLNDLKAPRKIAILGDMLELGEETEKSHREVGRKIDSSSIDIVVLVGKRMQFAKRELVSSGFPPSNILHFDDPIAALEKVSQILRAGDFVLVKGSQGMRMEKIVEQILADPSQAKNLLCRQDKKWKKTAFEIV